jgi:Mg-chelatase subunit ChlD
MTESENTRRWKLALGGDEDGLSDRDKRMSQALSALYEQSPAGKGGSSGAGGGGSSRRGGLGASMPRVSKWLGDIREFFPTPVVQVIQKDAFERLNLKALMLEPEFLETLEADVHLVASLISMRNVIPEKTMGTARIVVDKVVQELMKRLKTRTTEAIVGAVNKSKRTRRPKFRDIDWNRTIPANLRHYQPEYNTIVPETLIGFSRKRASRTDLDEVHIVLDQSGSMAPSVVYASIFAAVMASLPVVKTRLVCFDTTVFDLTDDLVDPVKVLFGIQLGGGTDINHALQYVEGKIVAPAKSHVILVTDLYEGGNARSMLSRVAAMKQAGVNVIVLLALSDEGRPAYDGSHASAIAAMGCPVFACTPDHFPAMMAAALSRMDVGQWAGANGIEVVRAA